MAVLCVLPTLLVVLAPLVAAVAVQTGGSGGAAIAEAPSMSPRGAMVVVEPRQHGHLGYVLHNFNKNMPPRYDLYIFHGQSTGAHARGAAAGIERRRAVHFVSLPVDDLSADAYNELLKSPAEFWDKIDAEHVLVFQTDSVLCSASPYTIADFEPLGYIGCIAAPDGDAGPDSHWRRTHPLYAYWGSGGLSFHRKSAALQCLAARGPPRVPTTYPEDTFYSECVTLGHGSPPPGAAWTAAFCTQDTFVKRSFGAHRIHDRLGWFRDMFDFLVYCPEAVPLLLPGPDHNLSSVDAADSFWGAWRQACFAP
ncbi:hypothetical protein ABPG75_013057 [Micractinium tetrahymenae]